MLYRYINTNLEIPSDPGCDFRVLSAQCSAEFQHLRSYSGWVLGSEDVRRHLEGSQRITVARDSPQEAQQRWDADSVIERFDVASESYRKLTRTEKNADHIG